MLFGAQVRIVRSGGGFSVLHAPRLVAAAFPRQLSLEVFGDQDLIPQGASVSPRFDGEALVRVRESCVLCHGPDGGKLGTTTVHLPPRTQLLAPSNTVEGDRVLRAKRDSESFRALQKFFREQ